MTGQGVVAASPTHNILPADYRGEDRDYRLLADIFGLSYAYEVEAYSYGPRPIPLVLQSILSLPPDFFTTDVEARRFLVEVETTRLSAFGSTYMVSILVSDGSSFCHI